MNLYSSDYKSKRSKPVILIIDDDHQFQKYISKLLNFEGYEVIQEFDGMDGYDSYKKLNPDLIVTDILMPKKEGVELIMEIRERNKIIPIIAVSGGDKKYDVCYLNAVKKLGANTTFEKPFDGENFLSTIKSFLTKNN